MIINYLWHKGNMAEWEEALSRYFTKIDNIDLDNRMNSIVPSNIEKMNAEEFYYFLYHEYFLWKYTAKNRLATTRKALSRYETEGMDALAEILHSIFQIYKNDCKNTEQLIKTTSRIHGLGITGASGLLSVLFPKHYGALCQFLLNALLQVENLPEHDRLKCIDPQKISVKDAVVLEEILRTKANELNKQFMTDVWTPRKIDMVLWALER